MHDLIVPRYVIPSLQFFTEKPIPQLYENYKKLKLLKPWPEPIE